MDDPAPRQYWMRVLARANAALLRDLITKNPLPPHIRLRGPETGLVMVQGRAGGSGGAFNMGEMTVVRCTIRNEAGQTGHATICGRSHEHAELAAAVDAALQDAHRRDVLMAAVITPLAQAQEASRLATAERSAATKVQFFTMATMRS
jgi:alpha-D-ribose 1-methylphosphonate 5-triphosphate synthase subunit PhnG